MNIHENFMRKCLDLAQLGLQKTKTNPLVGCVITINDKIISEGYHEKFGEEHAEIKAIKKIQDKSILKKATIYINLEPCAHFGKTPPCVDTIIKYGFKLVIIGTIDPFREVNGEAIKKLREKTDVIVGVLEEECLEINKKFFINTIYQRPLIVLKWAESKDNFINNYNKGMTQISCEESRTLTHEWRSNLDGIFVGTNTIICDNPQLTCRKVMGKNPIRITIDRNNRLKSKKFNIFNQDAYTIIFNTKKTKKENKTRYIKYEQKDKSDIETLRYIMHVLYKEGITSILIEGGKEILKNCLQDNLWDEIRIFKSHKKIKSGIKSPNIENLDLHLGKPFYRNVGSDKLTIIKNQKVDKKIRTIIL